MAIRAVDKITGSFDGSFDGVFNGQPFMEVFDSKEEVLSTFPHLSSDLYFTDSII
jgi:hypothetical protein